MSESTPRTPEWLSLAADERVWLQTGPSRNLLLVSLGAGFMFLTGMAILASVFTDLATGRLLMFSALLLVLVTVTGVFVVLERREYVLTSDRVYVCVGLLSTRVSSVALEEVRDITVEQSGWQHRLNVGSLRFVTSDDADPMTFALVEDPQSVHEQIIQVGERNAV